MIVPAVVVIEGLGDEADKVVADVVSEEIAEVQD